MENKLITVIMANYNTPIEYLSQAIDSILNQTYENFELVIIDDASTDGSLAYIESIRDSRITLIKNEINCGPAKSRNRGLKIAKGDYIAIMDSDDISYPNRLEEELLFMEQNEDVIVCGSWFEKFGIEEKTRKPIIQDFERYRCQLLFSNTPITICHSSAMFRKQMLEDNLIIYDESLPKAQDYGMWTVCSEFGRMAIIEKVLIKYRTHEKQISTKTFDEQAAFADLISSRQLSRLGVCECEESFRWKHSKVNSAQDFYLFFNWTNRILHGNQEVKLYKKNILKDYLEEMRWNAIKHMNLIELSYMMIAAPKEIKVWLVKKVGKYLKKKVLRR